ncbi:MAG: maleylacetoacetate isomerase [Betaproteobacteria bacterium]|nr:maleylacetoacetate isomerase [Betaproteobacteria bacterium]
MKLYSYFRSSAAYRVRIALALKGLEFECVPVHIARGNQFEPAFSAISAQNLVPVLEEDGRTLVQSLAIVEYLEETHPEPPLLPRSPCERARVRSLAQLVACEIHPVNNLRVLHYLTGVLKVTDEQRLAWYRRWVTVGFAALERRLAEDPMTGAGFCHGDSPGLADICLVPQVANARRFGIDVTDYPTILRIDACCRELDAFRVAAPENQPDAE